MSLMPAKLAADQIPAEGSPALQRILARRASGGGLPSIDTSIPAGGWQMKKLSQKHKHIIALHLQRARRDEIAQLCGCTPEFVSMVIKQPLAKQYLQELEEYMDARIRTAYGKAVDVVHDSLDSGDEEIRLKAAKLTFEVNGKMKPKADEAKTAEDLVSAILSRASTVVIANNVQMNGQPSGE